MQFWEHVEVTATCWLWTGSIDRHGYGVVNARGERAAHRLSWLLRHGALPAAETLDHTCRIRRCVNPEHLEPVSKRINTLRGVGPTAVNAAATTCKNGHPFDEANTRFTKGRRQCRACSVAAVRRYRQRQAVPA